MQVGPEALTSMMNVNHRHGLRPADLNLGMFTSCLHRDCNSLSFLIQHT